MKRKKKLLLINPGSPWFFYIAPPLALGYVAAVTPEHWDIEILDERNRHENYATVHADLVGITVMTPQAHRAYQIAETFTSRNIPVVLGGIHVSMLPDEAAQYATSVVVGEAEALWPQVIKDFEEGNMAKVYRHEKLLDIAHSPHPRRDLFARYPFDVIKTTRGCPFSCDFCCISAFNRGEYRLRPVDDVIEELKQIKNTFIFFADDNIVGSEKPEHRERAMALFEGIIRNNIKKKWHSQASINIVNHPEMLRLMRQSGCMSLLIGFESLDEEALKNRGKRHNLQATRSEDYYNRVVDILHQHGIAVNGFFLDTPSDSRETMLRRCEFLTQSDIDLVTHSILTPLPGTRLFERTKEDFYCHNFPEDWEKFDFGRLVLAPDHMSREEFYRLRQDMVEQTHAWKRIWRITFQGLVHSRHPLVALVLLLAQYNQRKCYRKELPRNLEELIAESL